MATVEAVEQGLVLLDALLPLHDGAHFREHAHRRTVVAALGQRSCKSVICKSNTLPTMQMRDRLPLTEAIVKACGSRDQG